MLLGLVAAVTFSLISIPVAGGRALSPTTWTVVGSGCGATPNCTTTIQAAIDAASAGDTVQVAPGTYDEAITIDRSLTLEGDPSGGQPTIQLPDGAAGILQITASDVTVQHLHLLKNDQASDTGIVTIPRGGSWPNFTIAYGNITLRDLLVENGRRGAYITGHDITIEDSDFQSQARDSLFFNAVSGTTQVVGNTFTGDPATSKKAIIFENFSSGDPATSGTIDVERNVTSGKNNFLLYDQWVDPSQSVSLVVRDNHPTGLGSSAIVVFDPRPYDASFSASNFAKIASVAIHGNDLSGVASGSQGVSTVPEVAVDATSNWWGQTSGPAADAVAGGTALTSTPWCTDDACATSSNDADLTGLSLSTGSLSPAFDSATTSYSAAVGSSATSIGVTTTASPGASAVVSGATRLVVGPNTVTVTVTSADGTNSKAYTITVSRASSPASAPSPTPTPTPTPTPATPIVNAPASASATPGQPGTVAVAIAPAAPTATPVAPTPPPVTVAVAWPPETFTAPVTVTVAPVMPPVTTATTPGSPATPEPPTPVLTNPPSGEAGPSGVGFRLGSAVVQLSVTDASGVPVASFAAPLQIHVSASNIGDIPAYSHDGTTWTAIPRRSSPELPAGQQDGYFVNVDGSIDIYTRHATYFGVLLDIQAPAAPAGTGGRVKGGVVSVNWKPSTDNSGKIERYQLLLGNTPIATLDGTTATAATTVKNRNRPSRYAVRAIDPSGNTSASSTTLTIAPAPRPKTVPKTVPAWAWHLLAWQNRPAASRGPRPATAPTKLPAWYPIWKAWRNQPFQIAS